MNSSKNLPVDLHKESILYLLESHRILIIAGETGSGKSTRIPNILFSSGLYSNTIEGTSKRQIICITQPRRVAAIQLAQRVSRDLNCNPGLTVGYAVRYKDVTSVEHTRIKFMTEGLLIREILSDPLATNYSVIIVDEVHERNLNTDILLGILKCIMVRRKDLRLIVCSATLDLNEYTNFFSYGKKFAREDNLLEKPAVLIIEGKSYPTKIYYRNEPVPDYTTTTVETVIQLHESNRLASGKILCFLTGQDEVDLVCAKLIDYAQASLSRIDLKKLSVIPLYASLKSEEIAKAFNRYPRDTRVCIVATNIAETSLTIEDVAFVIDCGFNKLKSYNYKSGVESLMRVPISKSSARQRAGRAGRTRDGIVFRLYPEKEYNQLATYTKPEIQRAPITETIMLLKSLEVVNLRTFPLISRLPRENLVVALELLYALKAIDDRGQLTHTGKLMSHFNLEPKLSKILVSPESSVCTLEVCRIVAMLQVKDIYTKQGRNATGLWSNSNLTNICASEGDLQSYLNIITAFISANKSSKWAERRNLDYRALDYAVEISYKLEAQLKKYSIKLVSCNGHQELVQKAIVSGLFSNAAYLHPSGEYRTIKGDQLVYIHPTSIFIEIVDRPKYVVFAEILDTTKTYMRHIMSINQEWLLEAAPEFYTFATELELNRND